MGSIYKEDLIKLYTVHEASRILGVSDKTVYYYFYKLKDPKFFVIVKEKGRYSKVHVTEEFIEYMKNRMVSEEIRSQIYDLIYDLYEIFYQKTNDDDTALEEMSRFVYKVKVQNEEMRDFSWGLSEIRSMITERKGLKRSVKNAEAFLNLLNEAKEKLHGTNTI